MKKSRVSETGSITDVKIMLLCFFDIIRNYTK